ncbi:helix-turn-helix transcriptional regulator [Bacillus sp. T33-2]|uniref:helix-turn-helix transcriptional regulator n=1 Tax=Bacillus sp. T33-2 TaxID=2054168 RepID=UPI0015E142E6|nr:helix-turn-helix domain-containing protein [Bacillus sp. T33-2]
MEKEFITVRSLSKLLDMSEQTTYTLSRNGVIPGRVKVGNSVRFNKAEVIKWLQNGGVKDDSEN